MIVTFLEIRTQISSNLVEAIVSVHENHSLSHTAHDTKDEVQSVERIDEVVQVFDDEPHLGESQSLATAHKAQIVFRFNLPSGLARSNLAQPKWISKISKRACAAFLALRRSKSHSTASRYISKCDYFCV